MKYNINIFKNKKKPLNFYIEWSYNKIKNICLFKHTANT